MKYKVLRCQACGEPEVFAFGIRSKCRACGKKLKPDQAFLIGEFEKASEASYVLREVKMELAKKRIYLEKGANYVGVKKDRQ